MDGGRTIDEWSMGDSMNRYYRNISNGRIGNYARSAMSRAAEYRKRLEDYNSRKEQELKDWTLAKGNDSILRKIIYDVLVDDDEGWNWNRDLRQYRREHGIQEPVRQKGKPYDEKIREIGHRIASVAQKKGAKWYNSWKNWAERQEGDMGKIFQSIFGVAEEEFDEDETEQQTQQEPSMDGLRHSVENGSRGYSPEDIPSEEEIPPIPNEEEENTQPQFTPQEANDVENLSVKMNAEVKRVIKAGYFNGPKLSAIAKRFMNLLNRKFRQAKASQGQPVNEGYSLSKGMLDEIAREVYATDSNIIGTMDALLQQIRQYADEGHFTPREMNTVKSFYRAISYVKGQAKGYTTRQRNLAMRQQQQNFNQPQS